MGILRSLQIFRTTTKDALELTEAQRLMYTAEKQENFRWVSKLVSGYSDYRLKEEDSVPEDLVFWLREIGEYRELLKLCTMLTLSRAIRGGNLCHPFLRQTPRQL
jgi:hypothetical protein